MALDKAANRPINLVGGNARPHHSAGQGPGLGGNPPGPAHSLNLPRGFQRNHLQRHQSPSASMITLLVPSMVSWLATGIRMPLPS